MQRAVGPKRAPPALHGQSIYAYWHVRTKQVLYSLTRALDSKQALKQLPDLGANATPVSIRKDLWKPLFTLTLPLDPNPRTPDGKLDSTLDNTNRLREHTQGIDAFRRLREYRTLHELYWTPPEELSYNYTEADIEEIEEKLKKRGGSKKETAHDIIKRDKKKMRRKAVMNQKATSVADLAEVLRNQEEAGLKVERKQIEAWRKARAEEVRIMVADTKDSEAAKQRADEYVQRMRERLRSLREVEGKRTKEGEAKRASARWKLAQAVKAKRRIGDSMINVKEAKMRVAKSREWLQKFRSDHPDEEVEKSEYSAVITKEEVAVLDLLHSAEADIEKEIKMGLREFVDWAERMMSPGDSVHQSISARDEESSGVLTQKVDDEAGMRQLKEQGRQAKEAQKSNEAKADDHDVLPLQSQRFEEVAQIWRDLKTETLDQAGQAELIQLMRLSPTLQSKQDSMVRKKEALARKLYALAQKREALKHKKQTAATLGETARSLGQYLMSSKKETATVAKVDRLTEVERRQTTLKAYQATLNARMLEVENELADTRQKQRELLLGPRKKEALAHFLISEGRDPWRRDFGVVGVSSGVIIDRPPLKAARSDPQDIDTGLQTSNSADGGASSEVKSTHPDTVVPDPSLPVWHGLLPSLKPLPPVVRGMTKHDPNRSTVRLLHAPIFKLDGIRIQWADIMDANYAESWPESVVHEELGWSRGTVKRVEDEPVLEPSLPGPKVDGPLKVLKEERDLELRRTVEDLAGQIVKGIAIPERIKAKAKTNVGAKTHIVRRRMAAKASMAA